MREQAHLRINASNREESMARVLSRAGFPEGTVLHAHRAAASALTALFAHNGWACTSDQCEALCNLLDSHQITSPREVLDAARVLDEQAQLVTAQPGTEPPNADDASTALDRAKCVRNFVNTVLTRQS